MNSSQTLSVIKSDGSHERFEFAKLRRCLSHAMRACQYDERYADALAQAVAMHLKDWDEPRPPRADYIFQCIRTVLTETGLGDVAKALVSHRRQRAARRRQLRVIDSRRGVREPVPWEKGRIALTLERRHRLARGTARILAGEIEQRVLGLNYSVISAALVAEVIRNELMAWGLSEKTKDVEMLTAGQGVGDTTTAKS